MKLTRGLPVLGASLAIALGAGVLTAPAANATTWTKSGATKANAYSWNNYKATVGPAGFAIPRGYVKVAAAITVKRGSTYVARNVGAAALSPGVYTVYSTFKYRTKVAYDAQHEVAAIATSCTVDAMIADGLGETYDWHAYTGTCVNDNGDMMTGTYTFWDISYPMQSGSTIDYPFSNMTDYEPLAGTVTERYTAYRYGAVKVAYRYRTATVAKVVNTSIMTRTEFNALGDGDSLARVRRVAGSSGTLFYDDRNSFLGSAYRWKNSSGSYAIVWFKYGYATDFYWYG